MDAGIRGHPGGIRSLLGVLNGPHQGAIRTDLLERLGIHLEDVGHDISWPEYKDWLENLPATGDSAYFRARHPHDWWYDKSMELAALQLLTQQGANWQRSGGKGKKPELYRPVYPKPERAPTKVIPLNEISGRLAEARRKAAKRKRAG